MTDSSADASIPDSSSSSSFSSDEGTKSAGKRRKARRGSNTSRADDAGEKPLAKGSRPEKRIKTREPRLEKVTIDWESLSRSVWGQVPLTETLQKIEQDALLHHAMQTTNSQDNNLFLESFQGYPPPHPGLLQALRQMAASNLSDDDPVAGRLDHSALVALGIYVEEMVTANLLPLAQQHVEHCRDNHIGDWMHPVGRIVACLPSVHLPSMAPPTRTLGQSHSIFNLPTVDERRRDARQAWKRSTRQDGIYVPNQVMDYFMISRTDAHER